MDDANNGGSMDEKQQDDPEREGEDRRSKEQKAKDRADFIEQRLRELARWERRVNGNRR
jgi:hypothetical protein